MRWLRALLRRSAVEREMDAEFRFHYQRLVEDFLARGFGMDEARRLARMEFGGLEQMKEDARDARVAGYFERAWRGLRLAVRNLGRNPGFAAIAVATLGLGIGANTLLFSLLDRLLLRNLPVRDPQRLVVFHGNVLTPGMYRADERMMSFSWPKYKDFRERCPVFSDVGARFATPGTLEQRGAAENVQIELVSGNYFDVLGVRPALGRLIAPADNRVSMAAPLVVLGYSYWQRRFAGERAILGQRVRINGLPMTIIGVSAPGFHSIDRGQEVDLRIPMAMKDLFTPNWRGLNQRFWAWLNIVARVKPGVSLREAEAGANLTYRQILQEEAKGLPPTFTRRKEFLNDRLDLLPAAGGMMDRMEGQKTYFLELSAIAAVVLLIACVNLAGLLMARTAARHRELAIRLALGAGRAGIVRQLLTENLLLAGIGGSLGIVLAAAATRPAARFLVSSDAKQLIDAPLDWRMLLFACGISIGAAAIFALAPILQMNRMEPAGVLKTESGASAGRAQVRLRKVMVAAQLVFCVWLTIGAGLFARSLAQVRSVDLGFTKERLITFQLNPMQSGHTAEQGLAALRRVSAELAALPGVTAVASSDYGVFTGNINEMDLDIEGYRPPTPDRYARSVRELAVTPGYFQALDMRLTAGRDFTTADLQNPLRVAIVNREFVRQYFGGQNPLGRHIAWPGKQPFEIIGVVGNQRYDGPAEPPKSFYYLPTQADLSYYVRTSLPAGALIDAVRRTVERQAPGVPIDHLRTMEEFYESAIGDRRRIAVLASSFGGLATILAAIGLYGVMAYTVARRTREIGIRMALGAARTDVMQMVIREVGVVIAAGLAVGVPSGLLLARLIRAQLFQVSPVDPRALGIAAAVVTASGLMAGLLPARRATRIDPMTALRWE
jgi:predicted permease